MSKIILGSTSPYKAELLRAAGFNFAVEDSNLDERLYHQAKVSDTAKVLAELKAKNVLVHHQTEDVIVITADVAGEIDGQFLGKPGTISEAKKMLQRYSNREVIIWTATTVAWSKTNTLRTQLDEAHLQFNVLTNDMIESYLTEKNPIDKGGAIAIEEIEDRGWLKSVTGERAAIIGLSLDFIKQILTTSL